MNVLFVYGEARVISDEEGNNYINGTITTSTWEERYKVLGNITFLSKKEQKIYSKDDAQKKFSIIDKDVKLFQIENNTASIKNYISADLRNRNNRLIEELVKKNDFIIARIPSDYSYITIDYAKKYNKPYMIEVVGCSFDSYWNHGISGKILAIPKYTKLKKYVKESKYTVYVSKRFLQNRYPTFGKNINCSNVALEEVKKVNLEKRQKKINDYDGNSKMIFGTCGGIDVLYKGQQYVIKALSHLKKKGYTNFEYQVVGGGTGAYLKKIAKKYGVDKEFKVIGSLPHDKVLEWMDNIDIYIQPSNQEGLCRSIIEAESRACPVIASNAGGNPELINNDYIFKKKNIKQLAKRIEKMNVENMKKESNRNFENSKQYKNDLLIKKRKDFYEEILKDVK